MTFLFFSFSFLSPFWVFLEVGFCYFCSKFSDIFDVEHFKNTLRADVRVVSSLPFKHFKLKETKIPHDASPHWIRARFGTQVRSSSNMFAEHFLDDDIKLLRFLCFSCSSIKKGFLY